jgi:hypothetical protein
MRRRSIAESSAFGRTHYPQTSAPLAKVLRAAILVTLTAKAAVFVQFLRGARIRP